MPSFCARRRCLLPVLLVVAACGSDAAPPAVDGGTIDGALGSDARSICLVDVDCNDGLFCNGREMCAPASSMADVRGCTPGDAPCSAGETCDEATNDCRVTCEDLDGDGHEAPSCGGDDCDDTDASRYPGNTEVCNSGDEDCNDATLGFVDGDGDGVASSACCNGASCGGDCDDGNADIRPGALDGPPDACNTIDDDCDGAIDEGCPCTTGTETPCYTGAAATRGIGRCADGFQLCVGGMLQVTCNDQQLPDAEICDTLDNDCDGLTNEDVLRRYYRDGDADGYGLDTESVEACSPPMGYVSASNDCDDGDRNRSPGAFDGCNAIDDDCDGMTDEGAPPRVFHADTDGDGFGAIATTMSACDPPAGYVLDGTDCDDTRRGVSPVGVETCDATIPPLDENCDGTPNLGCACVDGASQACGGSTPMRGACRAGMQRCITGLWAGCTGNVDPGTETCNGVDDDCDGTSDEGLLAASCYADVDSDNHGAGAVLTTLCADAARSSVGSCPSGYTNVAGDCNDANGTIRPGASEACNGVDDDCDLATDEGAQTTYYRDADSDGYGVTGTTTAACAPPPGYTLLSGDCNDASSAIRPGATELCDGVDQNCTMGTGDEPTRTFYRDVDGDLYGGTTTIVACTPPLGYVEIGGDCSDASSAAHPGATEICDGLDNDCDLPTAVDEAPAAAICAGSYPTATSVQTWACLSGPARCAIGACLAGRGDCDLSVYNGCETDTTSSSLHCGSCGRACGIGGRCASSACDSVLTVSAGSDTTCITRGSGSLVCWGYGVYGQVCDVTLPAASPPVIVPGLVDVDAVELGGSHVCAPNPGLTGNLSCWGLNLSGQVGNGGMASPVVSPAIARVGDTLSFAAGGAHTCVHGTFRTWSETWCWGGNDRGQLGIGTVGGTQAMAGAPITGLPSTDITSICAGSFHTCVVSAGEVWCWGSDGRGQLGNGGAADVETGIPVRAGTLTGATAVECGDEWTCALTGAGTAYCWGVNTAGQIGDGTVGLRFAPQPVGGGLLFSELELGQSHTCGRTTAGRVYCWGSNGQGQLGSGVIGTNALLPAQISPAVTDAIDLAVGRYHTCMVRTGGSVYCWGGNGAAQLGFTGVPRTITPTLVPGL